MIVHTLYNKQGLFSTTTTQIAAFRAVVKYIISLLIGQDFG